MVNITSYLKFTTSYLPQRLSLEVFGGLQLPHTAYMSMGPWRMNVKTLGTQVKWNGPDVFRVLPRSCWKNINELYDNKFTHCKDVLARAICVRWCICPRSRTDRAGRKWANRSWHPSPLFWDSLCLQNPAAFWRKRQVSTKATALKQSWYTGARTTYLDATLLCHTCCTLWTVISSLQEADLHYSEQIVLHDARNYYKLKMGTSNITTMPNM